MLVLSTVAAFLGLMLVLRGGMKYFVARGVGHGMAAATGNPDHAEPGFVEKFGTVLTLIGLVLLVGGGAGILMSLLAG